MTIKICNICGDKLEVYDGFSLSHQFGYGSKRDGDTINLDLCSKCLDKIVDNLERMCKHNPIIEKCSEICY